MAANRSPFSAARLRLTLWYMLITYALLALGTFAAITAERQAFAAVEQTVHSHIRGVVFNVYVQQQIDQFSDSFARNLLLFDVVLFVGATIASYFLSGRTLRPIEQMIHEQEQFALDASHELRTPLSNIAMEIEAHKRSEPKMPPEDRQLLESIQAEVARMRSMVAGLLGLVRSQSDSAAVEQAVDWSGLVTEVLGAMKSRFDDKKLIVTHEIEPGIVVQGSGDGLRQVLLILLDNAVKYTPRGGRVRVQLARQDKQAKLVVHNSGVTLAEDELPQVFERFYRGKQSKESGTGLGLAIAKSLVQRHGGSVAVASDDTGTSFRILLPLGVANDINTAVDESASRLVISR